MDTNVLIKEILHSEYKYYHTNQFISVDEFLQLMIENQQYSILYESMIYYLIPDCLVEFEDLKNKYKDKIFFPESKLSPFLFNDESAKIQFIKDLVILFKTQKSR